MTGREVTLPPVDKSHITNATAADYKDLDELRRRVADTVFAIKVCVEKDEQLEAIRSVIEVKWTFLPPRDSWTVEEVTEYLWIKGIRADSKEMTVAELDALAAPMDAEKPNGTLHLLSIDHAKCDWYEAKGTQQFYVAAENFDHFGGEKAIAGLFNNFVLVSARDEEPATYYVEHIKHQCGKSIHLGLVRSHNPGKDRNATVRTSL